MKLFEDILGTDGFRAIQNLCQADPAFKPFAYSRGLMKWLVEGNEEMPLTKFEDLTLQFQKTETGYKGEINTKAVDLTFEDFTPSELVGAILISTGLSFNGETVRTSTLWKAQKTNPLATLEKSLGKLLKARKEEKKKQRKKSVSNNLDKNCGPTTGDVLQKEADKGFVGVQPPKTPKAPTEHHSKPVADGPKPTIALTPKGTKV